jgi:hypothetical protein
VTCQACDRGDGMLSLHHFDPGGCHGQPLQRLLPITPAEIAWGETDGAVSINPEAVARRLNVLLEAIQWMQAGAVQCGCANCGVGWPSRLPQEPNP